MLLEIKVSTFNDFPINSHQKAYLENTWEVILVS